MSTKPLNLTVRFFLELSGLAAMAFWGWNTGAGPLRWLLAIGIPLVAAVLWGVFRVPGDPGKAPVSTAPALRLLLEAAFFGFAIWALFDTGTTLLAWMMLLITCLHYAFSYDRIVRFLRGVVT